MVWTYALGSAITVSILSFVGLLFLSFGRVKLEKNLLFLVSFAVGALAGDAFIHLIPEAFEKMGMPLYTSLLIIVGMLVFFVVEKFIRWRHCHIPTSEKHLHPVATLNLIGEGVHNLIDGILIGASYIVSIPIGITTTLAVALHEIPQEIGDFGVLIHAGFSVKRALLFNFGAALMAVLGTVIALAVGSHVEVFSLAMLPITAGGFIYIAASDLIPELQKSCDKLAINFSQFVSILLGIGLMSLLVLLE